MGHAHITNNFMTANLCDCRMRPTVFRPCIDLHNGKVKQIVGSTISDATTHVEENFVSGRSATHYAKLYQADGLVGGHVIMLGPGNTGEAFAALKAYPGGLQVGGGINPQNAAEYIHAGASHVIVTSCVFRGGKINWKTLSEMVRVAGRECLVLDLSCRQRAEDPTGAYYVVTDRWQKFTDFEVNPANLKLLASFCAEFLVHAVDVEGKQQGFSRDLVALLGEHSPIPVTYAGGIRSIEDLNLAADLGRGRVSVTVGSALDIFGGPLSYQTVVQWSKSTGERWRRARTRRQTRRLVAGLMSIMVAVCAVLG